MLIYFRSFSHSENFKVSFQDNPIIKVHSVVCQQLYNTRAIWGGGGSS